MSLRSQLLQVAPTNGNNVCVCPCPECESDPAVTAAKTLITEGQEQLQAALAIRDTAESAMLEIYNPAQAEIMAGAEEAAGRLEILLNYTNQSLDLINQASSASNTTFDQLQSLLNEAVNLQNTQFEFLQSFSTNDAINATIQQIIAALQALEEQVYNVTCQVEEEHFNSELFVKEAIINELAIRDVLANISAAAVNGFPSELLDLTNFSIEEIEAITALIEQIMTQGAGLTEELLAQANLTSEQICVVWEALNKIYAGFANYTNAYRNCTETAAIERYQSLIANVLECAERVTPVNVTFECPVMPPYIPGNITIPEARNVTPSVPPTPPVLPPADVVIPEPLYACPVYERCPPCPEEPTPAPTPEPTPEPIGP